MRTSRLCMLLVAWSSTLTFGGKQYFPLHVALLNDFLLLLLLLLLLFLLCVCVWTFSDYISIRVCLFCRFNKDGEIIKTIFSQYGQTIQTPPTIKGKTDLVFGLFAFVCLKIQLHISVAVFLYTSCFTYLLTNYSMIIERERERERENWPKTYAKRWTSNNWLF